MSRKRKKRKDNQSPVKVEEPDKVKRILAADAEKRRQSSLYQVIQRESRQLKEQLKNNEKVGFNHLSFIYNVVEAGAHYAGQENHKTLDNAVAPEFKKRYEKGKLLNDPSMPYVYGLVIENLQNPDPQVAGYAASTATEVFKYQKYNPDEEGMSMLLDKLLDIASDPKTPTDKRFRASKAVLQADQNRDRDFQPQPLLDKSAYLTLLNSLEQGAKEHKEPAETTPYLKYCSQQIREEE